MVHSEVIGASAYLALAHGRAYHGGLDPRQAMPGDVPSALLGIRGVPLPNLAKPLLVYGVVIHEYGALKGGRFCHSRASGVQRTWEIRVRLVDVILTPGIVSRSAL